MKHIVFLTWSHHPNFLATCYCAYQVQKSLEGDFRVSAIALRNNADQPLKERIGQIALHRVETARLRRVYGLLNRTGVRARSLLLVLRTWGALRRLLSRETVDRALVQAYLDELRVLEPKPDAIVCLVFPFETVLAALEYKKSVPDVAVYPYLFDDFVESRSLHVLGLARILKQRRHLRLERKMLEEADALLAMYPLRTHFEKHFDEQLRQKMSFHEHPLLTRLPATGPASQSQFIKLCFTGSLIKKVREPDYLLALLRAVKAGAPIRADFFVMGNDANKVRSEKLADVMQIVNHGQVTKSEADDAVRNADILLNLGEFRGKQISSKIFEYMSTGKPIIHLSYVQDDAVSKILERYPLALCISQDRGSFDQNVELFRNFVNEHRNSRMSFAQVEKLFPEALPESTAKALTELIQSAERRADR